MNYGLKYTVPFRTINEVLKVVTIEVKDYTGTPFELIGGATPIKIDTYNGDLLTPIRASSATVSVCGSSYLQDLYTSDPQGVRIKLLNNGNIEWVGFMTPDTFSQDFANIDFVYEIECVCALSTLKHVEFDLTDDFVTFLQIIKKARDYAGYSDLYLTNAIKADGSFYDLKIASANFYDELGEAMTYYEVLEEIAKYAGCTFTPYQDDLYLLDYAAIRSGFNGYEKYFGDVKTTVTLSDVRTISEYKGTGTRLSRIAGKNKAVVNCSLYEIKDLLPSFDDEGSSLWTFSPMTEYETTIKEGKENVIYKTIIRRYRQPKFTFFYYLNGNPSSIYESDSPPFGANTGSGFVRFTEFRKDNTPNRLSMTDAIQVKTFKDLASAQSGNVLSNSTPIFKAKSDKIILIHKDVWFCIGLQFMTMGSEWSKNWKWKATANQTLYQRAKFRIGNYFYNGTSWTTTESTFDMPISFKKDEQLTETFKSLDNNNTYDKGIGDLSGYTFKAPDFTIIGDCELTLYSKHPVVILPTVGGEQYVYYKDIRVDYGVPDAQSIYGDYVNADSKNDVIYENIIDSSFIEEADEIDLKICTNPDGKLALSSVIKGAEFLKTITSDAFGTDIPENILLKRIVDMFNEPRYVIDPVLNNDLKPYTMLQETFLPGKYLLNAGGEEDVLMESVKTNLIEL